MAQLKRPATPTARGPVAPQAPLADMLAKVDAGSTGSDSKKREIWSNRMVGMYRNNSEGCKALLAHAPALEALMLSCPEAFDGAVHCQILREFIDLLKARSR